MAAMTSDEIVRVVQAQAIVLLMAALDRNYHMAEE